MRLQHYSFDDSYDVSCDDRRQKSRQKNLLRFLRGTAFALGVTTLTTGGALLAPALFAPAQAAQLRLGTIDVQIDTTVSAGVSMRMEERNLGLISEGQGSNRKEMTQGYDPIVAGGVSPAAALAACGQRHMKPASALALGNFCMYNQSFVGGFNTDGTPLPKIANPTAHASRSGNARGMVNDLATNAENGKTPLAEHFNYDRGINGDDGRLNFDDGDLTGGTFKATVEAEARWNNFRAFTRVNAFYDAVMADEGNFERTELLGSADDELVTDLKILDAYLDYDFDLLGQPTLIRVGKQVINWGESTFILGGNSVFNPIDVPAFRRPGAEIKEALIPVNAVYASVALPYDLSLEAYYGEWDDFQLDAAGGPFANSDAAVLGSDGNRNKFFSGTGAYAGSNRRNCDAADAAGHTIAGAVKNATKLAGELLNTMFGECESDATVDIRTRNPLGRVEEGRRSYLSVVQEDEANAGASIGDTDFLTRGKDIEGDDENYGLALRWYAENLNSTEFGLYFQSGASRVPYVSGIARTPSIGISTTGIQASSTLRGAPLSGCLSGLAGSNFSTFIREKGDDNSAVDGTFVHLPEGAIKAYVGADELGEVIIQDPTGLGQRWEDTLFDTTYNDDGTINTAGTNQDLVVADAAANIVAALGTNAVALGGDVTAQRTAAAAILNADINTAKSYDESSLARGQILGCVASFANSTGGSLLGTGATQLATRYRGELFFEYPEVETIGLSFATTVFGWGVQGEVAIRDEMPLQLDTDAVYIATIAASCAWENFANVADVYYTLQTIKTVCGQFDRKIQGYVTEEVITYNLGTTATFTRSNPLINFLGADLGILLTEIGVQMADGIEDKYRTGGERTERLASLCTSGSDLPLGGVFSLDPRTEDQCRPTDESSGIVLFGQLQYNNVFGTPWSLSPALVHREGISGLSPVAGGFLEGVKTTSLRVTGNYQSNLSVALGYTQYGGDVLYNANDDRDTVSLTVTYGF